MVESSGAKWRKYDNVSYSGGTVVGDKMALSKCIDDVQAKALELDARVISIMPSDSGKGKLFYHAIKVKDLATTKVKAAHQNGIVTFIYLGRDGHAQFKAHIGKLDEAEQKKKLEQMEKKIQQQAKEIAKAQAGEKKAVAISQKKDKIVTSLQQRTKQIAKNGGSPQK